MRGQLWALAATVAVSVLSWRALPSAQTGPGIEPSVPRQDVMKDLLVEVRGLRAAIEQMAGAGPRIQLAMGRLQLQEQRVNTYLRQLETVRESLRVKTDHLADIRRELGGLETAPPTEKPREPELQRAFEERLQQVKAMEPALAAEVLRLQSQESEYAQQLAVEQNRWSDINRQLDQLDQALSRKQ